MNRVDPHGWFLVMAAVSYAARSRVESTQITLQEQTCLP